MTVAAAAGCCRDFSCLPQPAFDVLLGHLAPHYLAVIPVVCRGWKQRAEGAAAPLPGTLVLVAPLPAHGAWLQVHAHRLHRLTLRRCECLEWMRHVCCNLETLALEDARRLDDLTPLTELPRLRSLSLSGCRAATSLVPLSSARLTHLSIERCAVRDLRPLDGHATLAELRLSYDSWGVMQLRLPSTLPALRRMRIMAAIHDLTPLSAYTGLQELEVYAMCLHDVSPLSVLTDLIELDLHQVCRCACCAPVGRGMTDPSLSFMCDTTIHHYNHRIIRPSTS